MSIRDKIEGLESFIESAEKALFDPCFIACCPVQAASIPDEIDKAKKEIADLEKTI